MTDAFAANSEWMKSLMREGISYLTSAALHGAGFALLLWAPGVRVEFTGLPRGGPPPGWQQLASVEMRRELVDPQDAPLKTLAEFDAVSPSLERNVTETLLRSHAAFEAQPVPPVTVVLPVVPQSDSESATAELNPRPAPQPVIEPLRPEFQELLAESLRSAPVYRATSAPPLPEALPPRETPPVESRTIEPPKPVAAATRTEPSASVPRPPTPERNPSKASPQKQTDAPRNRAASESSESSAPGAHPAPGVDEFPRIEPGNRPPVYPQEAAAAGLSGDVLLLVQVNAAGRATDLRVLSSSNVPALDHAALEAVRQWRFRPAQRGGRAVAWPVKVPVRFRIEP